MTNDFETMPIGTTKEINLSRSLTQLIDHNITRIDKFNVMPKEVLDAYYELKRHYDWQIKNNIC